MPIETQEGYVGSIIEDMVFLTLVGPLLWWAAMVDQRRPEPTQLPSNVVQFPKRAA